MSTGDPVDAPADLFGGVPAPALGIEGARVLGSVEARLFGTRPRPIRLRRYLLLEQLASGAHGVVYRALDPELDRTVAIKLVRGGADSAGERSKRLLREAQAIAQLAHPNIVAIHDVGTFDSADLKVDGVDLGSAPGPHVFIVMELVEGLTLGRWLAAGPRSTREILDVFLAAGRGLGAAHEIGLVHRDFKPENVLVGNDGRVRVLDFGLARASDEGPVLLMARDPDAGLEDPSVWSETLLTESLTVSGVVAGTPAYMAPEQLEGRAVDARSDQFGFCVTLHEALHGVRPFQAPDLVGLRDAILAGQIVEATSGRRVPRWLRAAVLRGLAAEPEDRHPTMEALLLELGRDRQGKWRQMSIGLTVVLALGVGLLALQQQREARAILCTGGEEKVARTWAEEHRTRIEGAFRQVGMEEAGAAWSETRALVDDYVARWGAAYADACEATHVRQEQSRELLDRRIHCLDRRLDRVRALAELLADADDQVVERSVDAARALPALEPCGDAERLASGAGALVDPEYRAEAQTISRLLARAETLRVAEKWKDALPVVEDARGRAERLGLPGPEAEVLAALGRLQDKSGRSIDAIETLEKAALRAEEAGDDRARFEAVSFSVFVMGYRLHRIEEAQALADRALALLERTGGDPARRAVVLNSMAAVYYADARYEKAEPLFRQVLDIRKSIYPDDDPAIAESLNNLSDVLNRLGRREEALAAGEAALGAWTRGLGADNPRTSHALATTADALAGLGRGEEAVGRLRRALELIAAAWGPDHVRVAAVRMDLGTVQDSMGQHEDARRAYADALKLVREVPGRGTLWAMGESSVGASWLASGRPQEALEAYDRAIEACERADAVHDLRLPVARAGRGRALLALGRAEEALSELEPAVQLLEERRVEDELPDLRLDLARALWEVGRDRARARALVQKVVDANPHPRTVVDRARQDAALAWLAEHSGSN